MPGDMTPEQERCKYLAYRCYTGYDRRDKEKKNPIDPGKALEEWKELLDMRFRQRNSGGITFLLDIISTVKEKKTRKGLDLASGILRHPQAS